MSKKKTIGPWRVESVCRLGEIECANGLQIMDGDDVLVEMFEGNGWNKTQMKKILGLMAAAPQMKADIDAFLYHMDNCTSKEEAAEIARDATLLFRLGRQKTKWGMK